MSRIRSGAGTTFRSLGVSNVRLFLAGQLVSQLGIWVQLIAQPLLVLRMADSGFALGVVTACQFLPTLLFGAWAGVVCDRVDKRRLMYVTQGAMMGLAATLGILVLVDRISIVRVAVLAVLTGIAKAFDDPPRRTFVTDLVHQDLVPNAVALNSAAVNGARLIGPAVAAILITTIGIGWCFIVNAASFVAAIVTMARMDPARFRNHTRLRRARGQVRDGLRYVWSHVQLRVSLLLLAAVATLGFNWQVLLPLFAERAIGGDSSTYALLTTVMGVGSLGGSLFVARRSTVDVGLFARATLALGASSLLVAVSPNTLVAAIATFVWGITVFVTFVAAQTVLQLWSAPMMRGRVMALFGVVAIGTMPLGGLISGSLAELFGTRLALGVGGVMTVAAGLVALTAVRRRASEVTPTLIGPALTPHEGV